MLRAMRRLCTGYAALHKSDEAAEDGDAAAEPGCAALGLNYAASSTSRDRSQARNAHLLQVVEG